MDKLVNAVRHLHEALSALHKSMVVRGESPLGALVNEHLQHAKQQLEEHAQEMLIPKNINVNYETHTISDKEIKETVDKTPKSLHESIPQTPNPGEGIVPGPGMKPTTQSE